MHGCSCRTIKLHKLFETAKREKYVESRRPELDDYIYVWLLGKDPATNSIRGLADIRDHLNELSRNLGIPILIETTVEKASETLQVRRIRGVR
jgi:hypothetical protein